MNVEEIQIICQKLEGVTVDIKWGNHLCFNVGGKMFLVTAPDEFPVSASIKVSDENFDTLPDGDSIIPAPYMARHKWVFLKDINRWNSKNWQNYIKDAYTIVREKLPAKVQASLSASKPQPKKTSVAAKKTAKKRTSRASGKK